MSDAGAGGTSGADTVTVRLVMPDRWLEHVVDLPASTAVSDAKRLGLTSMLLRASDDPADFFVEYAERKVEDESVSLGQLGFRSREILSIRAYDLGHHKRFDG
jgi:hypothetical protein